MSTSNLQNPTPASGSVILNVYTGDRSAEIFIIDGQFNLVGRGIGPAKEFVLPPGLYKVKVAAGTETHEEHVALRPGSAPVSQTFPRFQFSSPAPLAGTSKTHEFHISAASENSNRVHVNDGAGSSIFVFARGWTEKQRTDSSTHERQHPARGLKLLDESGERIVADFEAQSEKDLGWEPWSACNVSVKPGNYRLQLEVPSQYGKLEQTVVASPNWQTQIFLLQGDYNESTPDARSTVDKRADVLSASVLMSPSGGFEAHRDDLRMVELARLALANERKILSDELRMMLRYKFENPMLGIFGAHILLLDKKPDMELFGIVIESLRKMVGTEHPDVEALALKLEQQSNYIFTTPPMLQRSWSLICQATADKPHLVPENSGLADVIQSWWGKSIWLTWLRPEPGSESDSAESAYEFNDLEEAILTKFRSTRYKQRRARYRSKPKAFDLGGKSHTLEEESVVSAARSASMSVEDTVASSEDEVALPPAAVDDLASAVQEISLDEETIKNLTLQLGIPRAEVEKTVTTLGRKMSDRKKQ